MNLPMFGLVVVLAATAYLQDGAVPVENEPVHKTVFKNEYVQAFRVMVEPGKATLMHTHSHDDAAVRLSTAVIAMDIPGQPVGPREYVRPGLISTRDNEARPYTHRVHNVGTTVFDVIDLQVLKRPPGPAVPAIAVPAAENARMRVYRYELAPGASSVQHSHARPYMLIAATDVELLMTAPGGASSEHPVKAGDMHWVDSAVTHTLVNRGTKNAILVEIEIK